MTNTPKIETGGDIDLSIPWFLDATNPVNVERRKKLKKELEAARPAPAKAFKQVRPAKSVQTDLTVPKAKPSPTARPAPAKVTKDKQADTRIIRVLVSEFGHKTGSQAETKSNGFRDGMTVAEYMADSLGLKGKWHKSHISHCVSKGFIKLEDKE